MTAPATIKIATRVQAHPTRVATLRRLLGCLTGFSDVDVCFDPEPLARPNPWRSYRPCLEAMPDAATHLLVVQDDAIPVDGFHDKLVAAIQAHPDEIVCAFTPGFKRERVWFARAHTAGERFIPMIVGAYVPVVCTVYPRAIRDAILEWEEREFNERRQRNVRGADDGIIAMFCRRTRVTPMLMVPCIAEHDHTLQSIGKSQLRDGPHRRAALLESPGSGVE